MIADDPGMDDGGEHGDDLLAAEYALGVGDLATRRDIEERIAAEPAFAARVSEWEAHFAGLNSAYGEVPAPAHILPAIEKRLFGEGAADEARSPGLWASVNFWRGLTFASLALAAGLAALTLIETPGGGEAELMAELSGEGAMDLVASYDPQAGALAIRPVAATGEESRSLELWLIPGENALPISLGLIGEAGDERIVLDDALRAEMQEGATLAVSVEPMGGSPGAGPSGPVIASGTVRRQ